MLAYQMLRYAIQAMAAVFGGTGIFAVYLSFQQPTDGFTAILMLGTALAMQRALDLRR